jgi:hypothetical protein
MAIVWFLVSSSRTGSNELDRDPLQGDLTQKSSITWPSFSRTVAVFFTFSRT